jgi:predicted DNA-binding transcriptional regulator AlpA
MGTRLLTYNELRDHGVTYTRRHLDNLERIGKFPKRVPLGDRSVAWVEKEIDAHVATKIAARSDAPGSLGSAQTKSAGLKAPRS